MSIINEEEKIELKELIEQFFSEEEEVKNQALERLREIGVETIDDFLAEELGEIYNLSPLEFLKVYHQYFASTREHEPFGEKPFVAQIETVQCLFDSIIYDLVHADYELYMMVGEKLNKLVKEPNSIEEKISILKKLLTLFPTIRVITPHPAFPENPGYFLYCDVIKALGDLGETEAEKVLLDIVLGDFHHEDTKHAAFKQLQKIGGEQTVDEMIKVLESEGYDYQDIKDDAARTLGAIDNPRSKLALEHAFERIGWVRVRKAIKEALNNIEPDYIKKKVQKAKLRIKPLLDSDDEESKEELTQLLKHRVLSVRDYSIKALGNLGDKRAISFLVNCFNTEDGETCETVLALAKLVKKHEISQLLRKHPLDIDKIDFVVNHSRDMHPYARQFIEEVYRRIDEMI